MTRAWRRIVMEPFRRSIRSKLLLAMIALSVIPIVAVTGLAADNNRQSMEAEVIDANLSNIRWTSVYLGDQFGQLNSLIYTIMINQHLGEYMAGAGEEESLSSQYTSQRNITDMLTSVFYSANPNVAGIELYVRDRNKLFTQKAMGIDIGTPAELPARYRELFAARRDFAVRPDLEDASRFQLIRSINRFENREQVGAISLSVRWTIFDQTLQLLNSAADQTVLVTDAEGNVLYRPGGRAPSAEAMRAAVESGPEPGYVRTKHDYVFQGMIDPSGLRLVKIIPADFVNQSARATMQYGLIIGAASVLVAILTAVYVAWRLAKPIVALSRSMQGLGPIGGSDGGGDLPLSGRIDEIGLLETKFLSMSGRIREHIRTEYSINLEKRTAELKALQAQINPHFLQNTLQLIGGMLFTRTPSESYAIIQSLSGMFRYLIREPGELATLEAEVEHLHHYMRIQRQRYDSRLRYTFGADAEALASPLPKLTLQPLVENAFFHGLDPKPGLWELDVSIVREEADTVIRVRDNGIGIAPPRLAEIRTRLESRAGGMWTEGGRIGLYNVAARIRLHFGERYGISLDSEPGQGTCMTVRIPDIARGEQGQ